MAQDEARRGAVDPAREPSYRPETDTDQALEALDDLPDAVLCFDEQDFCTYVNHQAARLAGRAREELLGEPLLGAMPEPLARVAQDHCRRVHQWGQVRCEARTAQGHYELRLMRQRVGYAVYLRERDVGAGGGDRAAEQALREADRRKDEFLASLAHELRNPLAPLANGLQILKLAREDSATVQQAQAMMERQLGQLVRLVDDLLDVSRISRGKIELRPELLEISQILDGAVETCQEAIRNAGVHLQVSLPASPLRLHADRVRLVQVVGNLLNNAAKFTPRGGHVLLSAERDAGGVLIRVRDTGVGIEPAQLSSVFDLFVQAERSLERSQVGLGVGLTIVRRLVELHGGRVEARSEGRGRGCEMRVWLPAAAMPDVAPSARDASLAPAAAPRRILLVDDNEDAAVSLAMALRLMQHEVRVAYDGLEALSVGEAFRPDVVLLDIGMPRLNGYDTARQVRLRSWGRGAILVALTGFGREGDRTQAMAAGFDHHLVKPADIDALRTIFAKPAA